MLENTKRINFINGAKQSLPLIIAAFPFGIILGTIATQNGVPAINTIMLSCLVFAGSSQFIAIGLFAVGASPLVILFTTLLVNIRHFLYSATLVKYVAHLPQFWRIILAFGLTDETFAVVKKNYDNNGLQTNSHWFYAGSIAGFFIVWNLSTIIGIVLGNRIDGLEKLGLDFAMYITFIGIIASYLTRKSMWLCLLSSGILSVTFVYLPHNLGITIAAIIAMFIATFFEIYTEKGTI